MRPAVFPSVEKSAGFFIFPACRRPAVFSLPIIGRTTPKEKRRIPMAKQLEKVYDPKQVEDRTYQFWLDKNYFHADAEDRKSVV